MITNLKTRSEMQEKRIKNLQAKLESQEKMPKSAAKEFGTAVSRMIEDRWEIIVNGLYGMGTDAAGEIIYSTKPTAKNLHKRVAALEKIKKRFPDESVLVDSVIAQVRVIEEGFKPYIKAFEAFTQKAEEQAAMPKPSKTDGPAIPAASRATIEEVTKLLDGATEELEQATRDDIEAFFVRAIEAFDEKSREEPITKLDKAFGKSSPYAMALQSLVKRGGVGSPRDPLILRDDARERAKVMADRDAKFIVDSFKLKTVAKLAPVVEGFPDATKLKLNVGVSQGAVQGALALEFDDKRAFSVRSQIVTSISPKGNWFARYPTTFHDYRQGDKLIKKKPSQAEMVDYGKGAPSPGIN